MGTRANRRAASAACKHLPQDPGRDLEGTGAAKVAAHVLQDLEVQHICCYVPGRSPLMSGYLSNQKLIKPFGDRITCRCVHRLLSLFDMGSGHLGITWIRFARGYITKLRSGSCQVPHVNRTRVRYVL